MAAKNGPRRLPTEADVADQAGVSQSAVSRAFTPGASIAEDTRRRIVAAAKRLGYHPNLLARSLSTKRSNIIGLAISNLENPFYAQMVKELSEGLSASGRHILLFAAPPGEIDDPALEAFLSYRIDSLILTAALPSRQVARTCRKSGVPVVVINRRTNLPGVSTVQGRNHHIGELVAAFLVAGGHKRFSFIGGTESSTVSRDRQTAYEAFLAGKASRPVDVRYGNYTFEGAASAARELLSLPRGPDAIFCASDYMAFAALDVARREYGLTVGKDVSIVGVDDVAEAGRTDLTTVSQPAAAFAREAIAILDGLIANPRRRARNREVDGELLVRGTARVPASGVVNGPTGRIWSP
jgi:DNA-binding LacI/PurR family transcriptional regulator